MDAQRISTGIQLLGALLGLPVAAAGAYTAYQAIASPVSCPTLRAELVAALDKPSPADPRRQLMRKSVADFERHCASYDADSLAVFKSVFIVEGPTPEAVKATVETRNKPASVATAAAAWAPLESRIPDQVGEKLFDEEGQVGGRSLVRARRAVALYVTPSVGAIDQSKVVGRIDRGQCALLVETSRTANGRPWGRVELTVCPGGAAQTK